MFLAYTGDNNTSRSRDFKRPSQHYVQLKQGKIRLDTPRGLRDSQRSHTAGFSLVELMVTLAMLAILVALAAPAFSDFQERSAVRGATEQFVGLIAQARFEAAKRNRPVSITMSRDGEIWCAGAIEGDATSCDCFQIDPAEATFCDLGQAPPIDTASATTGLEQVRFGNKGTRMPAAPSFNGDGTFTFDPKLGLLMNAADAGTITIHSPTSRYDYQLRLTISPAGRTWGCVPSGAKPVAGYRDCL